MAKRNSKLAKRSKWRKVGKAGLTAGVWLWDFLWSMLELMPDPAEGRREYIRRLDGWPSEIPRWRVREEVKRMKKRGWIIEAEKQGKKFIKLTEKGRLALLYRRLQSLAYEPPKKWGGCWWMAIYDIPEKGRAERRAICRALCTAGFKYLQKSVYVYPRELPKELIDYLADAKLLSYIRFVHVDQMDGARKIEKHFKVKKQKR